MCNKLKTFLLIPFLVIALLLTYTLTVSSQENIQQRQPISTPPWTTQPINLPDGILSNSGKLVAYSIKSPESWVNENIIIQDLETNSSDTIKLKLTMPFQIVSWSPDDSYLYIFEESQYYGGLKGSIVEVKSKKILNSFYTLNQDISWVNNTEVLYFDPGTPSDLNTSGVSLRRYNIHSNTDTFLLNKSVHNGRLPLVKFPTRLGEKFEFGITGDYVDYTSDITEAIEVNLRTGDTRAISRESLTAYSIKQTLPKDLAGLEITSIEEVQGIEHRYKVSARKTVNSEETINFVYKTNDPTNYELTY